MIDDDDWSSRWNEWQRKPKYLEETCSSAALSTTNSTWPGLRFNLGHHGGKPVTNRLSYGTALVEILKQAARVSFSSHSV
jgi:hypothetical protein